MPKQTEETIEIHFLLVICSNSIKMKKKKEKKKEKKKKRKQKQNKQQKNANYCSDICYKIILVINLI